MGILQLLNQHQHPLSVLDVTTWPDLARELLPEDEVERYDRYKAGITRLLNERNSYVAAAAIAGVDPKEFTRVLRRCLQTAPDGQIYGFRALKKFEHVESYKRDPNTQRGTAGLLELLFDQYPEVKKKVIELYRQHEPTREICREMLRALVEAGAAPFGYPFNTSTKAREAIRLYFKFRRHIEPEEGDLKQEPKRKRPILRPYQRVELDAHRCDAIFVITIEGPDGQSKVVTLERIWLLVLLDVGSRAVLGYALSLNRQCGIEDVLEAVQRAVRPMPRFTLTIPGLAYDPGAGFPNQLLTVCAFRLFDLLALDNALAHLSDRLHTMLNEGIQCTVNLGQAGYPDGRAFVERFFGTLTARGMKRMPSTTGSGPDDVRRNDPERQAQRYDFQLSEAEQLLDVLIANYNAEIHSGIHCSPLEYLRRYHREMPMIYRTVPQNERERWTLKHMWISATIRGKDRSPYVQYQGVEYRNQALTSNPGLVGKRVMLRVNVEDLRVIELFLNGASLGVLRASGRWALDKHSLKTRRMIMKMVNNKEIHIDGAESPVVVARDHLKRKAPTNKKAANQLARLLREMGEEPPSEGNDSIKSTVPPQNYEPEADTDWVPLRRPLGE